MPRYLAISGSLRSGSTNTAALEALRLLAPPDIAVTLYSGLAALPPFNPDIEEPDSALPAPVLDLRSGVGHADALIVSVPEYARGLAGSFKNLLDWLVGDTEFSGKRVAIIGTSPRAEHAPAQLRLVLTAMAARVVEEANVTLPLLGKSFSAAEITADPTMAALLQRVLHQLR